MSLLKKGDKVVVVAGGSGTKRVNKKKTGTIKEIEGCRATVAGLNFVTRHRKPRGFNSPGGKVVFEAPIHLSNLLYWSEKAGRGVKLSQKVLADGTKVRGYRDAKSKEFVQL